MKKLLFILLAVITALFSSCSKENETETPITPAPTTTALNIKASVYGDTPQTRASISSFPNGAALGLFITSGTLSNLYNGVSSNGNVRSTLSGSTWAQSPAVYLSPAPATVYAYYPYSSGNINGTAVPVEHGTQTDYLYGTHTTGQGTVNSENPGVNLTMNHALSLLQFKLSKNNYTGAGLLTKIEISNKAGKTALYSEGVMNIATGDITNTTAKNQAAILNLSYSLPASLPGVAPSSLQVMVLPMITTVAAGDVQILFTIDNKVYTYNIPAATKWEKGKVNTYTITLSGTQLITNNVTITDWQTGVNGSVELN